MGPTHHLNISGTNYPVIWHHRDTQYLHFLTGTYCNKKSDFNKSISVLHIVRRNSDWEWTSREIREKCFWQVEFIICEEWNEEWEEDMRLKQLIRSFRLDEQKELAHLDETESGDADLTV